MNKTGIFYGSSTGNTELIARKIAGKLGADVFDVSNNPLSAIAECSNLILGTSTWGFGDLQDDWDSFLPKLAAADLSGKTIALFGLGDADGYPDTFVDGMGLIYEALQDKGCRFVGMVPQSGYTGDASKALIADKYVGLPLDVDNQSKLTDKRITDWLEVIVPELL